MRGDGHGGEVTLALSHRDDAPLAARHALLGLMVDTEPVVTRDALLAVSELVSNVFLHTDNGCIVRASLHGTRDVRVEVSDTSLALPTMSASTDPLRTHGRGLAIVASIAHAWGVERRPDGKTVWAELRASS